MKKLLQNSGKAVIIVLLLAVTTVMVRLGLAAVKAAQGPAAVAATSLPELGSTQSLELLPLYEEVGSPPYVSGHGVSYLLRTDAASVLVDLGNNPEQVERAPVLANMAEATIPPLVDLLFISHNHPDHLGGLQWRPESFTTAAGQSLLDVGAAYVPVQLSLGSARTYVAKEPQVIAPGVATLGRMPFVQPFPFWLWAPLGYEQVLVVNVEGQGLVLITGCGHPTLERIIARAEALFDAPVVGIVGGLHYEALSTAELQPHIQFLAEREPQLVALSPHDNGSEAIQAFREAFPAAYQHIRVGEAIAFGVPDTAGTEMNESER